MKLSILVLAALVSISALAMPVSAQKSPDTRIDVDDPFPSNSINPRIASAGSSVYVVWDGNHLRGYSTGDVYFRRSRDRGESWDPIRSMSGALLATSPQIAVEGSTVHVVWEERSFASSSSADLYYDRSTDGGATWLPTARRLNTSPARTNWATAACIAVSGAAVYVAWQDTREGGVTLHCNVSADGGTSWRSSDLRLDHGPAASAFVSVPRIAASGSNVYVAWSDRRNGATDVFLNVSTNGGTTWLTNDLRLDTDVAGSAASDEVQIAVSGAGVHVMWTDQRAVPPGNGIYAIFYNRSTDAGATWMNADVPISSGPGWLSHEPQIAAVGSTVCAIWLDQRNFGRDVYFNSSNDFGATWRPSDIKLNTFPAMRASCESAQLAFDGNTVGVVWVDGRSNASRYDVHFNDSTDGGTTWLGADLQLDTDGAGASDSRVPQLAIAGSTVYAVWHDFRASFADVYFNIPFGAQPYGSGTPGSGSRSPQLSITGTPTRGHPISLDITEGLGGATGAVLFGVLPASRIQMPYLGGTLLVLPDTDRPFTLLGSGSGNGAGSVNLIVPNDPNLRGLNVNLQALFLDAGAAFGVSMTNAVSLWIG